jgi:hypothetical protein
MSERKLTKSEKEYFVLLRKHKTSDCRECIILAYNLGQQTMYELNKTMKVLGKKP